MHARAMVTPIIALGKAPRLMSKTPGTLPYSMHKCTHRSYNGTCISFVNAAQCQSQCFYVVALWHSLIWQKSLSTDAASRPVSAFPPNMHQDCCSTHSLFICNKSIGSTLTFSNCRPAKRQRQQGSSRSLQSQRQAWMHKLTSDAAQEVLLYMQLSAAQLCGACCTQ